VVIPTLLLLIWSPQWLVICYLLISSVVIFCYTTKSLFSAVNLCILVVGGIIADHFSILLDNYMIDSLGDTSMVIKLVIFCFIYVVLIHLYKMFIQKGNKVLNVPWFVQ